MDLLRNFYCIWNALSRETRPHFWLKRAAMIVKYKCNNALLCVEAVRGSCLEHLKCFWSNDIFSPPRSRRRTNRRSHSFKSVGED